MRRMRLFALTLMTLLSLTLPGYAAPQSAPARAEVAPVSPFGMNLYITGLERSDAERANLIDRAREMGVRWSREELSWANIQPGGRSEGWAPYDRRLQQLADAGI